MRILHFHFSTIDLAGGTETVIVTLAAAQRDEGHDLRFAELGVCRQQRWSAILAAPVATLPAAAWPRLTRPRSLAAAARLTVDWIALLLRTRPDVVHVHFPLGQALPILLGHPVLALLGCRPRLVVTLHGPDIVLSPDLDPRLRPWQRALLLRADRVTTVAHGLTAQLKARYPDLGRPVTVVANGIAAPEIGIVEEAPEAALVVFAGRCTHEKGLDLLIRAWATVRRAVPAARLLVLGDGPEREAAQAMAATMPEVGFAGSVARCVVQRNLQRAALLVVPSRTEALPMIILEAGAAGVPVVATAVGDVARVVRDGEGGRVVAPDDADGLAEALVALLRLPMAGRRALGTALQARVAAEYSIAAMLRGYAAAYGGNADTVCSSACQIATQDTGGAGDQSFPEAGIQRLTN